jgi:hypothetical protein
MAVSLVRHADALTRRDFLRRSSLAPSSTSGLSLRDDAGRPVLFPVRLS